MAFIKDWDAKTRISYNKNKKSKDCKKRQTRPDERTMTTSRKSTFYLSGVRLAR